MFQIIHAAYPEVWSAVLHLTRAHPATLICSQNRPESVPADRWAQKISPASFPGANGMPDGERLAQAVATGLAAGAAYVMIDELRGATPPAVAACAEWLQREHPEYAGRWGAFVVNGPAVSYARLNEGPGAIDALLKAGAVVACEMYPKQSAFCAQPEPDDWLAAFYRGGQVGSVTFPPRFAWLADRRRALGSRSRLTVLFGTTDPYFDLPTARNRFLDHLFHVWRARSGFPEILDSENGGAGSYKWDATPGVAHRVSDPTRDKHFADSWVHYCARKDPRPRLGPPFG